VAPAPAGNFRLAVDRSFTLAGAGLIVTGTVVAGRIASGAQAQVLLAGRPARVRGIHAQNAAATQGRAGQRCALNLAGEKLEQVARGDWIVQGEVAAPSARIDARVRVPPGAAPLRHWTPVHVHLGAADVTGRIAVLEAPAIAPGADALAQLVLDRPIGAAHGDRLILRDQSARRTLAGGRVIDVYAPARGRARPERLAALRAGETGDAATALAALLACEPGGVALEQFARNRNLAPAELDALLAQVPLRRAGRGLALAPARWEQLRAQALEALARAHRDQPDAPGLIDSRLLAGAGVRLPREVPAALVEELLRQGHIRRSGTHLHLPGHQASFGGADAALWERIAAVLEANAARPPVSAEIAAQLGETPRRVQALLERAAQRALVVRVGATRFFPPATVARLAGITEALAAQSADHRVTPVLFRERSELGRNLSVEVLEFFDRAGYTRRIGESRLLLRPAREVFGGIS
jgi:selenocysteine-specific elongation factor